MPVSATDPKAQKRAKLLSTFCLSRSIEIAVIFPFVAAETQEAAKLQMARELKKQCHELAEMCRSGGILDFVEFGDDVVPAWVLVEAIFCSVHKFNYLHSWAALGLSAKLQCDNDDYLAIATATDLSLKASAACPCLNPMFVNGIARECWFNLTGTDAKACPTLKQVLDGQDLLQTESEKLFISQ